MVKRASPGIWILVLFLVVCMAGAFTLYSIDTAEGQQFFYASYADMKSDRTATAANIPDLLPASAFEIRGSYSVEMNDFAMEFRFSSMVEEMVYGFQKLEGHEVRSAEAAIFKYPWIGINKGDQLDFFLKKENGCISYLALDRVLPKAYYVERCT